LLSIKVFRFLLGLLFNTLSSLIVICIRLSNGWSLNIPN
jgi:hypothetical protein